MSTTSRAVTKSNALVPENPVRYRMFGKLVTSSPSTWAAVSPSASADRRRRRGSTTSRQRARQTAKRQLVAIGAKTADRAHRRRSQHGVAPFRLARVNVGEVNLDEGDGDRRERVPNRQTGVSVRTGIDHDSV